MNRRGFLKFLGGGLAATATMAEAGAFAEFMDWIKRKPVWSFASRVPSGQLYDDITATTLRLVREYMIADAYFAPSPLYKAIIANHDFVHGTAYLGGQKMLESLIYKDAA